MVFDPVARQSMDIPTWLPYIGPQHDGLKHNLPPADFSFLYNASKYLEPRAAIQNDCKQLKIWGKVLDIIEDLTSVYTTDSITQENVEENARIIPTSSPAGLKNVRPSHLQVTPPYHPGYSKSSGAHYV